MKQRPTNQPTRPKQEHPTNTDPAPSTTTDAPALCGVCGFGLEEDDCQPLHPGVCCACHDDSTEEAPAPAPGTRPDPTEAPPTPEARGLFHVKHALAALVERLGGFPC